MEIHELASDLISRFGFCKDCALGKHSVQDLSRIELSDGDEWIDHSYRFHRGGFILGNLISGDGIDDISVRHLGRLVYKDRSYDGNKPEIEVYERGVWEEELRRLLHPDITSQLEMKLD